MSKLKTIFKIWLPFAVGITAFCMLAYTTVQQALRNGLNDPQIQMAEDTAFVLDNGATTDSLFIGAKVEISRSLAPFIVIYDNNGKPLAGSGLLDGQLPDFPKGSLDYARQNGQNRVSWQPNDNVRIAAAVVPYKDGFVMAGRDMREVEQRESQTATFAGTTWILAMIATFVAIAFGEYLLSGKK
jgi:hypothetical protein